MDDFPLHLWLFLPRDGRGQTPTAGMGGKTSTPAVSVEAAATSGEVSGGTRGAGVPPSTGGPNFNPASSTPQGPSGDDKEEERPMISFIAHVPSPIQAELERLQFLFLLRLKDSFNELKTSAMRFLSLVKPANEQGSPLVMSPVTPRQRWSLGNRHNTLTNYDENTGGVQTTEEPVSNLFEEQEKTSSASIGGCVIVRTLQADILLPSLMTHEKTPPPRAASVESHRATPTNTPALSSASPEPGPPSPFTTPTRLPIPHPPLPPSFLTLPTPHSVSESCSSLLSQTGSATSQTGFQQVPPTRTMSDTRLTSLQTEQQRSMSGSQTSLPILYESRGQGSNVGYHGDGCHGDNEEMVEEGEFVMVHSVRRGEEEEKQRQEIDTR